MNVQKSFLKWVGGKGRIIPQLLKHLPKGERLIEPFVGGGNVFINTDYKQYLLADLNPDLINVYYHLKKDYQLLSNYVKAYFDVGIDYYEAREMFNHLHMDIERAGLFIYLNRHCFNGVCRYNKNGQFNVPKGKHKTIYNPAAELQNFAEKLNKRPFSILLMHCDYQQTIQKAKGGDVIYCDPPYLPLGGAVSFNGYTPYSFDYNETERLANELYQSVKRGAIAVISNHDTPDTRYLFRQFKIHSINARRSVAANGNRQPAREIIGVLTPDMI
jgi:DNA adenine methylase